MAYPNVAGHVPPEYAASCDGGLLPLMACGDYLGIYNICDYTGELIYVPIVDHGPGAACNLDLMPCSAYQPTYVSRILDLTPISYADLGGNVPAGHLIAGFWT